MRVIVTISGGLSSAYCIELALKKYNKENIILYFNDTKWEHPDLYRFLIDIENYYKIKITNDSDGRNPEELFFDLNYLGNNRAPICSRYLKAERLQNFILNNDILIFGIDETEKHRSIRISDIYNNIANKKNINIKIEYPLIERKTDKKDIINFYKHIKIEIPELYKKGFTHNNCSGGCVRPGKKQWINLLRQYPDIYRERERVEEEFKVYYGKNHTFLKDISLKNLRIMEESKPFLFNYIDDDNTVSECIGICNTEN
jgi:3'-phosphoadenosine 5'-phosphosulfate sulfotransferase (PAPS reductase)/FAD synthetase